MTGGVEHLPHRDPAALMRWAGADDSDLALLVACAPRLSALFRLPAPHAPAMVVVGAVTQQAIGPPLSATGASFTPRAALAACLGEATEVFAQQLRPGDIVATAPLRAPPRGHALGEGELRAASGRGLDPDAPVGWVRAARLPDGAPCLLPAQLVLRGAGAAPDAPLSIGCAAGPTLAAATEAALLELFERDAVARWLAGAAAWSTRAPGAAACSAPWLARVDHGRGPPVVVARSSVGEGAAAGATVAAAALAALRELVAAETGALMEAARGAASEPRALPPPPERGAPRPGRPGPALARLAAAGTPVRLAALVRPDLAPVAKLVCFGLSSR